MRGVSKKKFAKDNGYDVEDISNFKMYPRDTYIDKIINGTREYEFFKENQNNEFNFYGFLISEKSTPPTINGIPYTRSYKRTRGWHVVELYSFEDALESKRKFAEYIQNETPKTSYIARYKLSNIKKYC